LARWFGVVDRGGRHTGFAAVVVAGQPAAVLAKRRRCSPARRTCRRLLRLLFGFILRQDPDPDPGSGPGLSGPYRAAQVSQWPSCLLPTRRRAAWRDGCPPFCRAAVTAFSAMGSGPAHDIDRAHCTGLTCDFAPIAEQDQRRDAADAVASGQILFVFGVDLGQPHLRF